MKRRQRDRRGNETVAADADDVARALDKLSMADLGPTASGMVLGQVRDYVMANLNALPADTYASFLTLLARALPIESSAYADLFLPMWKAHLRADYTLRCGKEAGRVHPLALFFTKNVEALHEHVWPDATQRPPIVYAARAFECLLSTYVRTTLVNYMQRRHQLVHVDATYVELPRAAIDAPLSKRTWLLKEAPVSNHYESSIVVYNQLAIQMRTHPSMSFQGGDTTTVPTIVVPSVGDYRLHREVISITNNFASNDIDPTTGAIRDGQTLFYGAIEDAIDTIEYWLSKVVDDLRNETLTVRQLVHDAPFAVLTIAGAVVPRFRTPRAVARETQPLHLVAETTVDPNTLQATHVPRSADATAFKGAVGNDVFEYFYTPGGDRAVLRQLLVNDDHVARIFFRAYVRILLTLRRMYKNMLARHEIHLAARPRNQYGATFGAPLVSVDTVDAYLDAHDVRHDVGRLVGTPFADVFGSDTIGAPTGYYRTNGLTDMAGRVKANGDRHVFDVQQWVTCTLHYSPAPDNNNNEQRARFAANLQRFATAFDLRAMERDTIVDLRETPIAYALAKREALAERQHRLTPEQIKARVVRHVAAPLRLMELPVPSRHDPLHMPRYDHSALGRVLADFVRLSVGENVGTAIRTPPVLKQRADVDELRHVYDVEQRMDEIRRAFPVDERGDAYAGLIRLLVTNDFLCELRARLHFSVSRRNREHWRDEKKAALLQAPDSTWHTFDIVAPYAAQAALVANDATVCRDWAVFFVQWMTRRTLDVANEMAIAEADARYYADDSMDSDDSLADIVMPVERLWQVLAPPATDAVRQRWWPRGILPSAAETSYREEAFAHPTLFSAHV